MCRLLQADPELKGYWSILDYSVCSKIDKSLQTCVCGSDNNGPCSSNATTFHFLLFMLPHGRHPAPGRSAAFVAVLLPDLGSLWAPLLGQHFCVTPESAPTQESDTCMGVAAASPPACWSMRQFPASGARRGRAGEPALLLSLILSGKSNGPLQQQPPQPNRVWLWSCFLMHYNHGE